MATNTNNNGATTMTTAQINEAIRNLVALRGWDAVRAHPVLGPIVAKQRADARRYVDRVVDR